MHKTGTVNQKLMKNSTEYCCIMKKQKRTNFNGNYDRILENNEWLFLGKTM